MEITYFGLSCFRFKQGDFSILTDPFDPKTAGISLSKQKVDAVLWTHSDQRKTKEVRGRFSRSEARSALGLDVIEIYEPGEYEVGGVFVRTYSNPAFHILTIDDVNICYLGMMKDQITDEGFAVTGSIDYLIIPVGDAGVFSEWKQVSAMIKGVDPGVVIPSCYKLPGLAGEFGHLKDISEFLREIEVSSEEKVKRIKKIKLTSVVDDGDKQYEIVILEKRD
ncbi:MAG: MBL fold metallo-hydrolase [Patescibacteria group bacterium]|nr:MBL fold metallo-hydrolase [Patescibacteria group bacterium]